MAGGSVGLDILRGSINLVKACVSKACILQLGLKGQYQILSQAVSSFTRIESLIQYGSLSPVLIFLDSGGRMNFLNLTTTNKSLSLKTGLF